MLHSKAKKSTVTSSSKLPLRIALKCSWSGSRLDTPNTLTASSTLSDVVHSVASQLPSLFSDSSEDHHPSIVYLRTTIWKKDWSSTTMVQMLGVDNCFGSVLLTLNLPDVISPSLSTGYLTSTAGTVQQKVSSRPMLQSDSPHSNMERTSSCEGVAMDLDTVDTVTENINYNNNASYTEIETLSAHPTSTALTPKEAVQQFLQQNFDIASKECLLTILKIVDNILSKPQDLKVRSLRLANTTIHDKIRSKKGGLEILFSIGFTLEQTFSMDLDPKVTLLSENENTSILMYTRHFIGQVLVNTLGVSSEDIPPMPHETSTTPQSMVTRASTTQVSFDPYKPFAFNVQSAAAGAPNPTSIAPDGVVGPSLTEQRLDQLKRKQMKIEQDVFRQNTTWTLQDRNLVVYPPPSIPGSIVTISSLQEESDATFVGSSKGDASLIAGRLKRLEDERKKREEGGFTTSAMREVDKLMNTKVYSHTQVRIDFPDGSWLSAKFQPHEKVALVKKTLQSIFRIEYSELPFDLYITPPKRILIDGKSLTDEGLVPAAKLRFTWKDGSNVLTSFIRPEFFCTQLMGSAYPESIPIVETNSTNNNNMKAISAADEKRGESNAGADPSKEDELVRRMLGKQSSILRPKGQR